MWRLDAQTLEIWWVWRLHRESFAVPLASGWGILGQLGHVLILIRPGDERDVRPIKLSVARQPVLEVATPAENQCLCNLRMSCTWVSDKVAFFWPTPRPLTLRSSSHSSHCLYQDVISSQTLQEVCIFVKHSKQNQTNKQHRVQVKYLFSAQLIRDTRCSCCSPINSHTARGRICSLPRHFA